MILWHREQVDFSRAGLLNTHSLLWELSFKHPQRPCFQYTLTAAAVYSASGEKDSLVAMVLHGFQFLVLGPLTQPALGIKEWPLNLNKKISLVPKQAKQRLSIDARYFFVLVAGMCLFKVQMKNISYADHAPANDCKVVHVYSRWDIFLSCTLMLNTDLRSHMLNSLWAQAALLVISINLLKLWQCF